MTTGSSGRILRFNPLNAELNPICHLLAFLGAHHILHISRIRVKSKATEQSNECARFKELSALIKRVFVPLRGDAVR